MFSKYLPEALDDATLSKMVDDAISEAGATSMQQMGAVMAILKPKCQGRVDMGLLSKQIKDVMEDPAEFNNPATEEDDLPF